MPLLSPALAAPLVPLDLSRSDRVAPLAGVRFGPSSHELSDSGTGQTAANLKALVAFAARDMQVFHFDTCPLGRDAVSPAALVEALEEAGVPSRLRLMR